MMLAIVIVAATLSVVGVIGYIFYLTPGPNDHI
jgi:preprotein translocase subunit Sss1